jgi:hypothetical protein
MKIKQITKESKMKRLSSLIIMAMLFLAWQALPVLAASSNFTVSATLTGATGVSITASSVNASTLKFTAVTGLALSFDPLTFNTTSSIWLPDHFFAIDVANTGGGGSVDTTVKYTEGTNQNSATTGHGMGYKTTATFIKVDATGDNGLTAYGPKQKLIDLTGGLRILPADVAGGYLRIYLGIVSKDPAAKYLDPASSEPFTNADKSGPYNGQFLVTATQTL